MPEIEAVDHIAIAVESIAAQRSFYEETLGMPCLGEEEVSEQGVRVAFFAAGGTRIELLEPTGPDTPVGKFLARQGSGLHHVAYRVRDLQARIDQLREHGVAMLDESPRDGAHGNRIAFLHPKASGRVLTELCEPGAAHE